MTADAERVSHTPGPWKVLRQKNQFWVHVANKHAICEIVRWAPGVDEADANLIAAAPDMLAELKQCALEADEAANLIRPNFPRAADLFSSAAVRTRAAIAKAEGRDV